MSKESADKLYEDIDMLISKRAEEDITYIEVIGVLQMKQMEMYKNYLQLGGDNE